MSKKIIASVDAENETEERILSLVSEYENSGADMLYIYNFSKSFEKREKFISLLRRVRDLTDLPYLAGVYTEKLEDVKKAYYSGAEAVVLDPEKMSDESLIAESVTKIGKDKVWVLVNFGSDYKEEKINDIGAACEKYMSYGVHGIMGKHVMIGPTTLEFLKNSAFPIIVRDSLERNSITAFMEAESVIGVATGFYAGRNIFTVKSSLKEQGYDVGTIGNNLGFSDFKINEKGLIPVVVQDYKTSEVLMLAYMNAEAYEKTLSTGKMTYWSRSRNELWVKGETSGHFQYVKDLYIDCDSDTLLAKVKQVGAACHTGNYSCFFTEIFKGEYEDKNIKNVLEDVFNVILDRKANPKPGSYTNYLFDKGIDKILKKCGEEATEIVIAAKNPDHEELRYEIADFLYHMMVLMADTGLTWEDIMRELKSRE